MNTHKCIDTINASPIENALPVALSLTWQGWIMDGKRLMQAEMIRAFPTLILWRHRLISRRHLSRLNEDLLKDIGLTSQQARQEVQKPFWRS